MQDAEMMTVDVRDMTCAQALAVVALGSARLNREQFLDVLYNAQDVKHDLMVWARDQGLRVLDDGPERVRLQR